MRTIIIVSMMFLGCTCGPGQVSDPCDGVNCNANEVCEDGACVCNEGFEGSPCAPIDPCKNQPFNPAEFLASMTLEPGQTGIMDINLPAGDTWSDLNGTRLEIVHPETVTEKVYVVLAIGGGPVAADPANYFAVSLPNVDYLKAKAISFAQPKKSIGGVCRDNEIPLNQVTMGDPANWPALTLNWVGTALSYDADWIFAGTKFSFENLPGKTLVRLSDFLPVYAPNRIPDLVVADKWVDANGFGHFDLTGTDDELLADAAFKADGLALVYDGSVSPMHYRTASPLSSVGQHNLTVSVEGVLYSEYTQDKAVKTVDLTVADPCDTDTVCSGENRACTVTGITASCGNCLGGFHEDAGGNCVADEVCGLNSCSGHEVSCTDDTGIVVCVCVTGWDPDTHCGTCLPGFIGGDCHVNLCYEVNCTDNGDVCDGNEACDPADGQCKSFNALVCVDSLTCNGTETCDPDLGCQAGTAVNCNSHGSCQEPAGSCTCNTGFDPAVNCSACSSGYGGTNCDPVPTISGLAIDCSSTSNFCLSAGLVYPVTFSYTNVTSCTTSAQVISGGGTPGSTSTVNLNSGAGSFDYTTGSSSLDIIRITLNCSGPGGETSDHIDVTLE